MHFFLNLMSLILILFVCLNILMLSKLHMHIKYNSFECGLSHTQMSYMMFPNMYYIILVLFLIFDVEITLFMPLFIKEISTEMFMLSFTILLMILLLGFMLEWKMGSINWMTW